jgi:hypothetical protein
MTMGKTAMRNVAAHKILLFHTCLKILKKQSGQFRLSSTTPRKSCNDPVSLAIGNNQKVRQQPGRGEGESP